MEKKTNKKPLIAIAVLAIIGIVGGTFAYFTSTATFQNLFQTATYQTVSTETFVSPTDWAPGTTTDKTITVKNEGSIPVGVQVCYNGSWSQGSGLAANLVTVNRANTSAWTQTSNTSSTSAISGCFVYNTTTGLAPGATAPTPIASVTLSETAGTTSNGEANCTTRTQGNQTIKTCTAGNLGGASFTLNVTVTTVQFDKFNEHING